MGRKRIIFNDNDIIIVFIVSTISKAIFKEKISVLIRVSCLRDVLLCRDKTVGCHVKHNDTSPKDVHILLPKTCVSICSTEDFESVSKDLGMRRLFL